MNQNPEPQKEISRKKGFSFFSLFLAIIIILAIIIGSYLAFFPNKNIELPFLSKEIETKINTYIENPSKIFEAEKATPQKQEQNKEPSLFERANEIYQKITSAETPAAPQNPEDNLAEHDMAQQELTIPLQSSAENSDTFSLEPPSSITPLENGRRMLTDEEIAEAQEKDRQIKLEKLNALRNEQTTGIYDTDNLLPTKQGSLSSAIPDSALDPVVTLFFIHDLADYLVNNYLQEKAVTIPRLNQRYGVGLIGLEHNKGRAGVLEYAYNENMLPILYKHLSPALINAMKIAADKKNMPLSDQKNMFNAYGSQCRLYADAIHTLTNVPQLSENIQNLAAIEDDLKKEEKYFAENLLNFEQNRDDKALARTYEENVKQSTIRSSQLRSRISNVRNDLRQYLISFDEKLAKVPNCLELALWLDRRKNPAANTAFANTLDNFANDVSALFHE